MKMDEAEDDGNAEGGPVKLQLVTNPLWRELSSKEQTDAILHAALRQMRDGYWLAFPGMVCAGRVCMGVALVAKRDWRTARLKDVRFVSEATHVAILLLFRSEVEWKSQARTFTGLWPEQPEARAHIIDPNGDCSTFALVDEGEPRI